MVVGADVGLLAVIGLVAETDRAVGTVELLGWMVEVVCFVVDVVVVGTVVGTEIYKYNCRANQK